MSQLITCPNCGQTYTITPEQIPQYAGRTIQCTKCAQPFAVNLPTPTPTPTPTPAVPFSEPVAPATPPYPYPQQPPPMQPAPAGPVGYQVQYQTPMPAPKASGLAITALVFGCLGVLVAPLGLVGIILGIIALLKTRDPRVGGRGLAIAGISVGGASIVISACMLSILLPSLNRARETANRVKCASNLRQIGQAMLLYANDNRGVYPPTPDLLLLTQDIAPEAFVCPTTNDTAVSSDLVQQAVKQPNTALLTPGKTSYVYVGKGQGNNSSAEAILAYEAPSNHEDDGSNFLYGDGHVSFEDKAHADAIIAELKAGNNPPRWKAVQEMVRTNRQKR